MSSAVVFLVLCLTGLLSCLTVLGAAIWAQRPHYRRRSGHAPQHRSEEARLMSELVRRARSRQHDRSEPAAAPVFAEDARLV